MKIIISDLAKASFKDIYDYHTQKASRKVATTLQQKIVSGIKNIVTFHSKFQKEESTEKIDIDHRRCEIGNYKITYRVLDETTINVTSIFDTRQAPSKIKV